ncbi:MULTISPECIES: shikimate dehydrogenase [unclassified Luteococcus]|uniref:shikimate dehydrogenase n=1 Tax=unclassified Luteococcus TaxID=2639923 RepID=UPI00313C48A6
MTTTSKLAGLIGLGIGPSMTPHLHESEGERQGFHYVYRLLDLDERGITPERVGELVRAAQLAGYDGLNITYPVKQVVMAELDALSPEAEAIGAVNTVVFTAEGAVGHNTDATGYAAGFRRGLPDAPMDLVVQMGAGGAGSAVAHALVGLGARQLVIVDVDPVRAQALAERTAATAGGDVRAAAPGEVAELLARASGVVNCTPVGSAKLPGTPFDTAALHPGLWVSDVVYRPLRTQLILDAEAAGCRVLPGSGMAVGQAVDAFRLITGHEPDADAMAAELVGLV